MPFRPIRRALLSVHDKTGLVELGRGLRAARASSCCPPAAPPTRPARGRHRRSSTSARSPARPRSWTAGSRRCIPASMAGSSPAATCPSIWRRWPSTACRRSTWSWSTSTRSRRTLAAGADFAACIEQIDVGGPAMIRAAAKNHDGVAVIVEPGRLSELCWPRSRPRVAPRLASGRRLAAKAFARTAAYDAAIAGWLARETGEEFPERVVLAGTRRQLLRYGENPHQRAAFYATGARAHGPRRGHAAPGQGAVVQQPQRYRHRAGHGGRARRARRWRSSSMPIPAASPSATSLLEAYRKALACDPLSAFGGIVACNRPLDARPRPARSHVSSPRS